MHIQYAHGGAIDTGILVNRAFDRIPVYWQYFLGDLRVVIVGTSLGSVPEIKAEIVVHFAQIEKTWADALQEAEDEHDQDFATEIREYMSTMCEIDVDVFDGIDGAGDWLRTEANPPTIYLHQGDRPDEEFTQTFLRDCGRVLIWHSEIGKAIERTRPAEFPYFSKAIGEFFDRFCLELPVKGASDHEARQRIIQVDRLLKPQTFYGRA